MIIFTIVSVGRAMTHPLRSNCFASESALGSDTFIVIEWVAFILAFIFNNLLKIDVESFIELLVSPSVTTRLVRAFEESSHRFIRRTSLNLHKISSLMIAKK